MDNQEESHDAGQPTKQSKNWIVRSITYVNCKFEKYRARRKQERIPDRAARQAANATWVIAFFTAATVCIGYLQWSALHSTDEKIEQQVKAIRQQLTVLQSSDTILQKTLEASSRAWLVPSIEPLTIALGKPLTLRVHYENIGKTPALGFNHRENVGTRPGNYILD